MQAKLLMNEFSGAIDGEAAYMVLLYLGGKMQGKQGLQKNHFH